MGGLPHVADARHLPTDHLVHDKEEHTAARVRVPEHVLRVCDDCGRGGDHEGAGERRLPRSQSHLPHRHVGFVHPGRDHAPVRVHLPPVRDHLLLVHPVRLSCAHHIRLQQPAGHLVGHERRAEEEDEGTASRGEEERRGEGEEEETRMVLLPQHRLAAERNARNDDEHLLGEERRQRAGCDAQDPALHPERHEEDQPTTGRRQCKARLRLRLGVRK